MYIKCIKDRYYIEKQRACKVLLMYKLVGFLAASLSTPSNEIVLKVHEVKCFWN